MLDYNGTQYPLSNEDAERLLDNIEGHRNGGSLFRFQPMDNDTDKVIIVIGPGIPVTITWKPNG